jgi:hypothetical protein
MALKKFSEVAKDGCCPKCGYVVMKRGVNAITGNLAVGLAAGLVTNGLLGPRAENNQVRRLRNQVPARLTSRVARSNSHTAKSDPPT